MSKKEHPRWDLSNIYPGIDSDEFKADQQKLEQLIEALNRFVGKHQIGPDAGKLEENPRTTGEVIGEFLTELSKAFHLFATLDNYVNGMVSADTFNEDAKKKMAEMKLAQVKLEHLEDALFKGWLGTLGDALPEIIESNLVAKAHAFYLAEAAEQSKYLMSSEEEKLAGELSLSGIKAWFELYLDASSKLKWAILNENDEKEELPIMAIDNLKNHPDEKMRRRGYEASLEAFASIENTLSSAINGVKGTQVTLFNSRGREDPLHESLDIARVDRATLDAMLSAVQDSLPMLQNFYRVKARRLGKSVLPFWDLSAPTIQTGTVYTYEHSQKFILENFLPFSSQLADLAKEAFDNNWIDVGPREGKGAGAFCMGLPAVGESRILLNFEENLNWVFALSHELGHAFHNSCLLGKTWFQQKTPMTLAETASLMCETIVTNAAVNQTKNPEEELAILEASIQSTFLKIMTVYQMYLIESEIFERRADNKLSAAELNQISEWAQTEVYGEVLKENYRFPYLWARLPHFYIPDISFYNYPYTFGLLLGVGLYAVYKERGSDFVPQYIEFLSSTGTGNAADLAAQFGIDLRDPGFWEDGLAVIGQRIARYAELSDNEKGVD